MTKLKDKLSASVRMAKASQKTTVKPAARKPAPAKIAVAKPVANKPAAKSTAAAPANKTASRKAQANDVPAHSDALFPARVWPD